MKPTDEFIEENLQKNFAEVVRNLIELEERGSSIGGCAYRQISAKVAAEYGVSMVMAIKIVKDYVNRRCLREYLAQLDKS